MAFAPADLRVRASIAADPENRAVEVIATSNTFYSSSEIQLDEHSRRTTQVEFRSLPAGSYQIRVVVKGRNGKEIAVSRSEVTVVRRTE